METLWQLEANIDDMNPQNMEYVFFPHPGSGANDVWAMPMMMKKGRMASMLCVLCRQELIDTPHRRHCQGDDVHWRPLLPSDPPGLRPAHHDGPRRWPRPALQGLPL